MIASLAQIDQMIFLFINVNLANPVTDLIMPWITSDNLLRVMYAILIASLLIWGDARLRWLTLFSAVALLLSDQLSASFLKPLIARPRPCQTLDQINLLVNCGAGYSMPSSHAANAYAQAALFSFWFKKWRIYFFAAAGLIAFSRIFVGVHYPGDIIAGALVGILCGNTAWFLYRRFEPTLPGIRSVRREEEEVDNED